MIKHQSNRSLKASEVFMSIGYDGTYSKRGYLKGDFEFFHIKDQKNMQFEFHYHDFNKIIIFVSGKVTYLIEGKAYRLRPWDILLVSNKEIHKPIIESGEIYERIVIWVNPIFIEKHNSPECDLSSCFNLAMEKNFNLLRLEPELLKDVRQILSQLEKACKSDAFGNRILKNSLFMQLIVYLNREYLGLKQEKSIKDIQFDESIVKIINHINDNLTEDLSIESLAANFFMSKYYLMHKFRTQTGYSIHNYILQKRLIKANSLLLKGVPASEISLECGFGDYSTFVRAFKRMFGASPKQHYKNMLQLQQQYKEEGHF